MSDETTENATGELVEPSNGVRWKWFPVFWIGVPLATVLYLRTTEVDPGITNSIAHASVYLGTLGFAIWAMLNRGLAPLMRWAIVLSAILFLYSYSPIGPIKLILDGDVGLVTWKWRWGDIGLEVETPNTEIDDWQTTPHDYPRFLGNGYWAEVEGVELETDWETHPPRELWRKKIGDGWSAFAIVGNYAVTQEQRDDQEMVTCYDVKTGDLVWSHADPVRWDPGGAGALGFAGPRATPTIHEGKVFAHGATGIVNCLDAKSGKVVWSHSTLEKHSGTNVVWGKACSPLIVDDMVVISVGSSANQSVVAYHIESGEVVWASGEYQSSYASPIVADIGGVRQVVTVDEGFVTARQADNGEALWEHPWPSNSGSEAAASQPIPLPGDRLFVSKGYGLGSVLLQVSNDDGDDWRLDPIWKVNSSGVIPVMKTKMGNVVVRDGQVYGIDDVNLQCIDLETGKKRWKKRRRPKFGHGQIMLIGDTILVLSEVGEVILVEPNPKKYRELASMRVFEDTQITWNNPAFASPYLLLRNAEEAVCYELPLRDAPTSDSAEVE